MRLAPTRVVQLAPTQREGQKKKSSGLRNREEGCQREIHGNSTGQEARKNGEAIYHTTRQLWGHGTDPGQPLVWERRRRTNAERWMMAQAGLVTGAQETFAETLQRLCRDFAEFVDQSNCGDRTGVSGRRCPRLSGGVRQNDD